MSAPLYVSDLDGTLLDRQARLSRRSRDTLNRLLDEGLAFTVATARSVHSVRSILEGLHLRLPLITFNGVYLSDLATGEHAFVHAMAPDVVQRACACISASGAMPLVSAYDGTHELLYHGAAYNGGLQAYLEGRLRAGDRRLREVANPAVPPDEQVVSLTVIDSRERIQALALELAARLGDQVNVHAFVDQYHPPWWWLTLQDARATKANAIMALRTRCGFEGAPLVVFGDQVNDASMFAIADRALAVAGAVEELKAAAHAVLGAAEEDSVARYLSEAGSLEHVVAE